MRTLIVTASDSGFFDLLQGLLRSLQQWQDRPYTDIALFDIGLTAEQRAWAGQAARHIVEPGWDLPVAEDRRKQVPVFRAMTVRPFLPRYFPGYDLYIWLDADTWVQERFALDWLTEAAAGGRLAAVSHNYPPFPRSPEDGQWRRRRLRESYGETAGDWAEGDEYINAGVFAARADAPHWAPWAKWFEAALKATAGKMVCDQTSLNHAIHAERLPLTLMPALCNWLCYPVLPGFDRQARKFCEPDGERRAIGILHLVGQSKNYRFTRSEGGERMPENLYYFDRRNSAP